ncbi:MAG: aspartate carbamoyltransferase regulatory subunit [Lachnospiraceae bacterium]|nr:aspartate carbamoyltransferase regulatory subunit [Lachnospiraceae bacterium]
MLNVGKITEGFVLDHIEAGTSLSIYHDLKLDQFDRTVAIIKNARSNKMGKKDILKIECGIDELNLDILGFIDHNITVNIVKDGEIVEKMRLELPREIHNIIKCKNPRCITSIEQELEQVFILTDPEKEIYRCKYCEEKYSSPKVKRELLKRR